MSKRIYRYMVPVDDRWHTLQLSGQVVHVNLRAPLDGWHEIKRYVEVWAEHVDDAEPEAHEFRVYGTGHTIEEACHYVGTAFDAGGALVWHLMELDPQQ